MISTLILQYFSGGGRQVLNSKASLEASQAAFNRIMKFANFLESQQQNLAAYGNELPTLLNRVLNYNNVIVSHYYYIYPILFLL